MTRRRFVAVAAGALAAGGLGAYSYWEAGDIETRNVTIPIGGLPRGFDGCRVAFLSDMHLGPFISREFVAGAVRTANALNPDIVFLGGDFVHQDPTFTAPAMEELAKLRAPLGVFAVQGNRDIWANRILTSRELARQGIEELTNMGRWIERGGSRIWLCGVDDATIGCPDVAAALRGATPDAVAVMITHNPEIAETLDDPRIRLVCCGHTHGGQLNLPILGRPLIFSKLCKKYAEGLVQAPHTKVFTTTGVGSFFPPLRFRCPPEVALLTLIRSEREISEVESG